MTVMVKNHSILKTRKLAQSSQAMLLNRLKMISRITEEERESRKRANPKAVMTHPSKRSTRKRSMGRPRVRILIKIRNQTATRKINEI